MRVKYFVVDYAIATIYEAYGKEGESLDERGILVQLGHSHFETRREATEAILASCTNEYKKLDRQLVECNRRASYLGAILYRVKKNIEHYTESLRYLKEEDD